ncbi:hypothetical protein ELQ92_00065 [Labedella populi]|uniref:Uncharacterized protein n=1 Tax=Labedella populi TaxID=2498850 RepID=A0A3S4E6W4_9MICO|nr:hypothetical protein [Labedella populi]RWZ67713.1 hypothetical protein ELQ92_00065 [Labedella populi]
MAAGTLLALTPLGCTTSFGDGFPSVIAPERFEEFAPGLDPELLKLIQKTAAMEPDEISSFYGPVSAESPAGTANARRLGRLLTTRMGRRTFGICARMD